MKCTALAWLQFLLGLAVLGSSDYYVRRRDGWLGQTGTPTPDLVWFGVPVVLAIVGVALLWRATDRLRNGWVRLAVVAVQAALGFMLYLAACLWYVLGTGVDSL
jgi:uncharacterized BrkB/YihY/UPF0761 family membrane protein